MSGGYTPAPPIGESGFYCVEYRHWLAYADLLPLRGKRRVKAAGRIALGDRCGRCPRHPNAIPVAYVRKD